MFKENTCSCFHPMWKLTSLTMAAKVLRTTLWVPMHLLPWAQCKRWIPIESMGCVHMDRGIPAIEGWGSPSHIRNIVEKIGEVNWKLGKIGQIVNQTFAPMPKHDKTWAWWASDIHQRTCWKGYDGANILRWNLEVEPFVVWWVVHTKEDMCKLRTEGDQMPLWSVAWKGRCYCQLMLKLQEGRTLINHKPNNYNWNYKDLTP
jgi:hypothetical protein